MSDRDPVANGSRRLLIIVAAMWVAGVALLLLFGWPDAFQSRQPLGAIIPSPPSPAAAHGAA